MKLVAPASTLVTTDAPAMPSMTSRIDPEGAAQVMDMLINAYSDPILAAVRENVSNAVDATRMAGSTTPVSITSPTAFEPNFVVTDQGTGMSAATVESAFLTFAGSTKRGSNDAIGGYGVGAKSPWALAESFLIDTVKDGQRTIVRASRDLNHQVLMLGEPTDLPNGTTISIPVNIDGRADEWTRAIREVTYAHDSGLIVLDGQPADSITDNVSWIGPVAFTTVRQGRNFEILIRSGGTLFNAPDEVVRKVREVIGIRGFGCLIELPIGSFDHTISREIATATDRTMAAVNTALDEYQAAYEEIAEQINELAERDTAAAVKMREDVLGDARRTNLLEIDYWLRLPEHSGAWYLDSSGGRGSRRGRWTTIAPYTGQHDLFPATSMVLEMKNTVIVSGVPAGRTLRGFATWLRGEHPGATRVVPIPEGETHIAGQVLKSGTTPVEQTWAIGPDTIGVAHYTFDEWTQALKENRATYSRSTAYECAVSDTDGQDPERVDLSGAEIAELDLPVVYVNEPRPGYYLHSHTQGTAAVTVYLGRRKEGPLLKAVPGALSAREWAKRHYAGVIAEMTEDQRLGVAWTHTSYSNTRMADLAIAVLKASPDHPMREELSAIRAAHECSEQTTEQQRAAFTHGSNYADLSPMVEKLEAIQNKVIATYPLLSKSLDRYYSSTLDPAAVDYVVHMPPRG